MASIARIKCFSCNLKFEFYFNLRETGEDMVCQHCFKAIPKEIAALIHGTMASFSRDNADLRDYSAYESGNPLFQFDLLETGTGSQK